MDSRLIYIPILIYLASFTQVMGQKVTVSNEITIRNNVAFDIIGRIGDRILFYQDKGNEREIMLYDNDLVFQSERQINLDQKRCNLYEVVNMDTAFAVIYGYRKDGEDYMKLDVFSNTATRLDSVLISKKEKNWRNLEYESVLSEDESKIALYNFVSHDKLKILIIDIDRKEAIKDKEYEFKEIDFNSNVDQISLANDGTFFILTQINNTKGKKKNHKAHILKFAVNQDEVIDILIPLNDIVCQDLAMSLDNAHKKIGLAGLYHEKKTNESSGYFWVMGDYSKFDDQELALIPFDDEIYFEVYGEKNKGRMENFRVAGIIWKSNSAPLLVLEMAYDVSRQSAGLGYNNRSRRYGGSSGAFGGGWSDHYRDDLILISLNENGEKDWHQVFYKKQFSQNDNAVFSSFFPFITPSRMRLIYNDEIKNNSTVSEYILDAEGNYKRTSVLSTEYQDLKLRFSDASQISATELLVPSHKNYGVNIVKIDFGN